RRDARRPRARLGPPRRVAERSVARDSPDSGSRVAVTPAEHAWIRRGPSWRTRTEIHPMRILGSRIHRRSLSLLLVLGACASPTERAESVQRVDDLLAHVESVQVDS